MIICDGEDGILIVVLVVGEPEQPVALERPTEAEARLPAGEGRIRIRRAVPQTRVSCQIVIPIIEKRRSMQVVRATPGHDVDGARTRQTRGEIKVEGRDLKLLHRLLRKALRSATNQAVAHRRTIDRDARLRKSGPANQDLLIVVSESPWIGNGNDLDAGFELRKLQKAPAVEWQVFDLHPADAAVYFVFDRIDARDFCLHVYSLCGAFHF